MLLALFALLPACSSTDTLAAAQPTEVAYYFSTERPPMLLRNEAAVGSVEAAYSQPPKGALLKVASDDQMATLIGFFQERGMFDRSAPQMLTGASSHLVVTQGDQRFVWSRLGFDTVPAGRRQQYDECREAFRVLYDGIQGFSSGSMSGDEMRQRVEDLQDENRARTEQLQRRLEELRREGR